MTFLLQVDMKSNLLHRKVHLSQTPDGCFLEPCLKSVTPNKSNIKLIRVALVNYYLD